MDKKFEEAIKLIRPIALSGVPSPYFVAAQMLLEQQRFDEARNLLRYVSKEHWQYDEAINFERSLYEEEINLLKSQLKTLNLQNLYAPQPHVLLNKPSLPETPTPPLTFSFSRQKLNNNGSLAPEFEKTLKTPKEERPMEERSMKIGA